ncbi:MAG: acyl-CoA dehydrogenase family protein, partial [Acidobacteria bacterium]|nr:acyl-CoA dehydrogenase family protein [Acidobacteriota bacterium]
MAALIILLVFLIGAWALAFIKAPLWTWTVAAGVALAILTAGASLSPLLLEGAWILWFVLVLFNVPGVRQPLVMAPLLTIFRRRLPPMSTTEREALEAGTVWWDAELFSGHPRWERLLDLPPPRLSEEEQAFVEGPAEELCRMLDDWRITHELRDLPFEVWEFIKNKGFFGMIIPKQYGGLGFSAQAHSAVIAKISSRSGSAAVTVMVPNSLGPAELLLHYGTEVQKNYYLPRLADGREIPCFALTGPFAGSDASSIPDRGVVCYGSHEGKKVLGLRVTWEKRYITLAPVATVLGLAFQLYDPERLLGEEGYLGITLALIPT